MSNFLTRPRFQDRDIRQISGDTITLSGETNINGVFRFIPGAVTGYVLKAQDSNGTVYWDVDGGASFSGNTSGTCISDLYVSNIHSCSNLNINPLNEGNVYFGSTSGVTIDLTNTRLGIGTNTPNYPIQVLGNNSTFWYDPTSLGGNFVVSGNTGLPRFGGSNAAYLTKLSTGWSIGMRCWDDVTYPGYGKVGDMHIYAGNATNGINIINSSGTGTEDYIRFYAGKQATSTSDIHIQGSGITIGYVGIGTESPSEKLDVNGKTKTINFQMTSGATNGYVLTSDSLGNASWSPPSPFTGNTSGDCVTDLWVTNIHGCSPITIWDSIQSLGSDASGLNAIAFGIVNESSGAASFSIGGYNKSTGVVSYTEGAYNIATGSTSHAEGYATSACTDFSHTQGYGTATFGTASHAQGYHNVSSGDYSHTEGSYTRANGNSSHAEGSYTKAEGDSSHAGGQGDSLTSPVVASGNYSFAHFRAKTSNMGVYSQSGVILGGENHLIKSGSARSVIIGGSGNQINEDSISSSIFGGDTNKIYSGNSSTTIVGGQGNNIHEKSNYSVIVGGLENTISGHSISGIFAGSGNTIDAAIPGNMSETIIGSIDSSIVGPISSYSSIIGGSDNHINNGAYNFILGGYNNNVSGQYNTLLNAIDSSTSNDSTGNVLSFTPATTLYGTCNSNFLLGNVGGVFSGINECVIINSPSATLNYSSRVAVLVAGTPTVEGNPTYSLILGGYGNTIYGDNTDFSNSAILGGSNNLITSAVTNSVILGGSGLTANQSNTVYVPDLVIKRVSTPTSSGDTVGEVGSVSWDDNYFYTKTNTGWGRVPLDYGF